MAVLPTQLPCLFLDCNMIMVTGTLAWTKNPNLGIYEKKLAEGSAFLVYNWICNGQNLQKPKIFSLDAKTFFLYMSSYVTHI